MSSILHCLVYRATFPMTFKEISQSNGDGMKVFLGVSVGVIMGIVLAQYLRKAGKLYPTNDMI